MKTDPTSATRREFLSSALAVGASTLLPHSIAAQTAPETASNIEQKLSEDPMRPQFHLLPARNWMNDPNGPIYVNGKYHMFFQYNPQAAVWGNMSWNHAVSIDMLHWTHDPVAFTMTPNGPDAAGCFSGSAIALDEGGNKRVYVVYTGVVKNPEKETIRSEGLQESQCLAWSDDPALKQWTKLPVPIIPFPPKDLKVTGFRDPSVWPQDGWYYMTVGSGVDRVGGCVLLYRSKDLKKWEYLHQLVRGEWNRQPTPNPCNDGEMWECPEFFALDGGHVLIYSTLGKVFWQSGTFDSATMKFTAAKMGELDLGAFYAPKTQLDAEGRRILWGWIPEKRSDADMKAAGWSGMMSLPRCMTLDQDGSLRITILPQAASLRAGVVAQSESRSGILRILQGASGEVMCSGTKGKNFTFSLSTDAAELMQVMYSGEKHAFIADGTEIGLQPGDIPTLHAFVDGSVIELIISERIGLTRRFYYTGLTAPDVRAWVHDGTASMNAWKIKPISPNRLTTPAKTA